MKQTDDNERDWPLTLVLAILAGLLRLVLPWNFASVGAVGLFAGARFRSWRAFAVPLGVMAVSDLLLWAFRGATPFDPWVYASFVIYVLCGRLFLSRPTPGRVIGVSLAASLQFFLITNFGAWLTLSTPDHAQLVAPGEAVATQDYQGMPVPAGYTRDLRGLLTAYVYAVPFVRTYFAQPFGLLGNTVASDLLFTGVLFGLSALARRTVFRPRQAAAPAEGVAS
jgi:hypothetical protein